MGEGGLFPEGKGPEAYGYGLVLEGGTFGGYRPGCCPGPFPVAQGGGYELDGPGGPGGLGLS
jgi:hypothetical protein